MISTRQLITTLQPLADRIPNFFTHWFGEYLFWRACKQPEPQNCSMDGQEWTVLYPRGGGSEGLYEPLTTKTLMDALDRESVFWDVGCNVGYYPTTALQLTEIQPSNIHAFEPVPNFALMIETNMDFLNSDPINLVGENVGDGGDSTLRLDKYAAQTGDPDVVKIDAGPAAGKGAEDTILTGMADVLDRSTPTLFVEVHFTVADYQHHVQSIRALLSGHGYDFRIARDHRAAGSGWQSIDSLDQLPEKALPGEVDYMLFAKPDLS